MCKQHVGQCDGNPAWFVRGAQYPVERVTYDDVQQFIRKLNSKTAKNYQLPTEAKWEYAARSGGKREKYAGGPGPNKLAWFDDNSKESTHPVGGKKPNGLGLYDLAQQQRTPS